MVRGRALPGPLLWSLIVQPSFFGAPSWSVYGDVLGGQLLTLTLVGKHEAQSELEEQGGSPLGSSASKAESPVALRSHPVPQASPLRKQILGNWQGFALAGNQSELGKLMRRKSRPPPRA